ncbi:thiol peroxidase [Aliikangiella maris]|uniref:Thiol peroxidase n=2 Tax=Aliikangiella maris TaxID=3162458 RepID=A0ABV3MSQ5_9GAMM
MASLTFKNNPIETVGNFPEVGQKAPDFKLVKSDLSEISLSELAGKKVIFNIFPSIDTPVCAAQLKKFNEAVANIDNTVLLFASLDLPFAFARFCGAEGIENAVTTSDFRYRSLAESYGIQMKGGPLDGLYARAVLVLNENQEVIYSELVNEVTNEPDYDAALATVSE